MAEPFTGSEHTEITHHILSVLVENKAGVLSRVVAQLYKLINVVEIQDLSDSTTVQRELLLATVHLAGADRGPLLRLVASAGAAVIDFLDQEVTVSLAGTPRALDTFEENLAELHVQVQVQRTGRVALPRLGASA